MGQPESGGFPPLPLMTVSKLAGELWVWKLVCSWEEITLWLLGSSKYQYTVLSVISTVAYLSHSLFFLTQTQQNLTLRLLMLYKYM
jgi:hypothetical protein